MYSFRNHSVSVFKTTIIMTAIYKDSKYLEIFKDKKLSISYDGGKTEWNIEDIKSMMLRSIIDTKSREITSEQVDETGDFLKKFGDYMKKLPNNGSGVLRLSRLGHSKRVSVSYTKIFKGNVVPTMFRINTSDISFKKNHVYFFSLDHSVQILFRDVATRIVKKPEGFAFETDTEESNQCEFVFYVDEVPQKDSERKYYVIPTPSDKEDTGILHVAIIPLCEKIDQIRVVLKGYKTGNMDVDLKRDQEVGTPIIKAKDSNKHIFNLSPVFDAEGAHVVDDKLAMRIVKEKTGNPIGNLLFGKKIIGTPRRRVLISGKKYATGFISNGDESVLPKYWGMDSDNGGDLKNLTTIWKPISKIALIIKDFKKLSNASELFINGWSGNMEGYEILPRKLRKINIWLNILKCAEIKVRQYIKANPQYEFEQLMQIVDFNNGFNEDRLKMALSNLDVVLRKENEKTITVKIYNAFATILNSYQEKLDDETKKNIGIIMGNIATAKDAQLKLEAAQATKDAADAAAKTGAL